MGAPLTPQKKAEKMVVSSSPPHVESGEARYSTTNSLNSSKKNLQYNLLDVQTHRSPSSPPVVPQENDDPCNFGGASLIIQGSGHLLYISIFASLHYSMNKRPDWVPYESRQLRSVHN